MSHIINHFLSSLPYLKINRLIYYFIIRNFSIIIKIKATINIIIINFQDLQVNFFNEIKARRYQKDPHLLLKRLQHNHYLVNNPNFEFIIKIIRYFIIILIIKIFLLLYIPYVTQL